ncbi:MAG: hypothetical protein WDO70_02315 [Alphaproteobacteria bacterium]
MTGMLRSCVLARKCSKNLSGNYYSRMGFEMLTILLRVRVLAGVLLAALLFVPLPASAKTPVKYLFARQPQQQQQANPFFCAAGTERLARS